MSKTKLALAFCSLVFVFCQGSASAGKETCEQDDCGTIFTFDIDRKIRPEQATVPGLSGGRPRPVGVTIGPDGKRDEFVANEVVIHPSSDADLFSFLEKYDGVVLRDGTPMLITEAGASPAPPDTSSGAYLIRVDLRRSSLSDLRRNMTAAGFTGRHLFSSNAAARLAALLARPSGR